MNKYFQSAVIMSLMLLGLTSCNDNPPIGLGKTQPYYIQEYVENPEFSAAIWSVMAQEGMDNSNTGQLVAIVYVNEQEGTTTHVINYISELERFLPYAKRYKDLSYNRPIPGPNVNGALAEPLSKVQCYELSSTGEYLDVSDKVILRALTILPYIQNNYKDDRTPEECPPGGMRYILRKGQYLINKPLPSLTTEDLTLLDYKSLSYLLELIPITPYRFEKQSKIKIVISESGKTHEIKAEYSTSK